MASPIPAQAQAPLPHHERVAAHEAAKSKITTGHAALIARLDDARRLANDTKVADLAKLEAEHDAAHEQALQSVQHAAVSALQTPIAEFIKDPSRANAANLGTAFRAVDSDAVRLTGAPLGSSLAHAWATVLVSQDATLLRRLANFRAYLSDVAGCLDANDRASNTLRDPAPTAVPRQHEALCALEVAIGGVIANGHEVPAASAKDHFDIVRFGGSKKKIQATISQLEAEDRRPREEAAWREVRAHRGWSVLSAVTGLLSPIQPYSNDK